MDIYNGVRFINITSITKSILSTLYVRGNRIKIKYKGQDRTPICGICKTKVHYRTDCSRNRETEEEKDDPISPYMTGKEKEVQQEPTSAETATDSDTSKITTNNSSLQCYSVLSDISVKNELCIPLERGSNVLSTDEGFICLSPPSKLKLAVLFCSIYKKTTSFSAIVF